MMTIRNKFMASVAAALCIGGSASAADIKVALDKDHLITLPPQVGTIIIGNPLIADVALASGGEAVVTGKSYGKTNIILLDRHGAVLTEQTVVVRGPDDVIAVRSGASRQSYSCTPVCGRRDVLGDSASLTQSAAPGKSSGPSAGQRVGGSNGGGAPCNNPNDKAADGSRCGGRAASERPGGKE